MNEIVILPAVSHGDDEGVTRLAWSAGRASGTCWAKIRI